MKKNNIQIFADNIKSIRKTHKLTQIQMAKKLRIGLKSLRLLEKVSLPPRLSADILFVIYDEFGIFHKDMFDKLYLS